MTYQSIADALSQCFAWFNNFIYLFVDFITDNPLVSAGVLVLVGVPITISVLLVIFNIPRSTYSMSISTKEGTQNVFFKVDKTVNKIQRRLLKKKREEAIEAQRFARGRSPGKNNKYVNAYIDSLKK